jgi:hypothetical protein
VDWITDDILIGNYLDAQDFGALKDAGVELIIGLNGERYDLDYVGIGVHKRYMYDLIYSAVNGPFGVRLSWLVA